MVGAGHTRQGATSVTSTKSNAPLAAVTPGWLTIREAQQRIGEYHNAQVSYVAVQKACLRYRHRMEGRAFDDEPVDAAASTREDPTPGPRELRCAWKSMGEGPTGQYGRRLMYLVDPSDFNIEHLEIRGLGAETAPGRRAGGPFSLNPRPRKKTKAKGRTTRRRPAAGGTPRGARAAEAESHAAAV